MTGLVICVVIALVLLWDGWLLVTGRETVSHWVRRQPAIVPFLVGMACGHWFWFE